MTAQELIAKIASVDYDGQKCIAAREHFLNMFPRESLPNLTADTYLQNKNSKTFCYNLEYVSDLPFGIKGSHKGKFGKPSNRLYPYGKEIAEMIRLAENDDVKNLKARCNLVDVFDMVLIKILSIYLPDKFIPLAHEYTLTLFAKILGVYQVGMDLIELNYHCNRQLLLLQPDFANYEYNRIGNAIWRILSPVNESKFRDWVTKTKKSGSRNCYVACIEKLSLYYMENFYSPDITVDTLIRLYNDAKTNQQKEGGKFYYEKDSYGRKNYYSAAVGKYMDFIKGADQEHGNVSVETLDVSLFSDKKHVYPKNIILYGPPGTGKTYNTIRYAVSIIEGIDVHEFDDTDSAGQIKDVKACFNELVEAGRIVFTTFHQSLSYEDFIEGIRPETTESNENVLYNVKSGIFVKICETARKQSTDNYVLIIDEINRGNVASIFGELITLIECDKREGKDNYVSCTLPYSGSKFSVPDNLYIIGTMNTADRSVEALDSALRRRFDFVEMLPNKSKVTYRPDVFDLINKRLRILKDDEHQLGHSYFMNVSDDDELCDVFRYRVVPLIQEYFYGDMEKIRLVLGDGFCVRESVDSSLFSSNASEIDVPNEIYRLWGKYEWEECKSDIERFRKAINQLINSK